MQYMTQELSSLVATWDDTVVFYLNGRRVSVRADPEVTLLEYLRGIGLTGTKLGCAEGGCGACTVVVSQRTPSGGVYHAAVNACLAPVVSVDGKHVITVEGVGSVGKPHPVQERIARMDGSQCGFCTPGIVMSLYALIRNTPRPSREEVEEAFDGNLCRCTGYRPILNAAQTFSSTAGCNGSTARDGSGGGGGGGCCMQRNGVNGANEAGPPAGCCKQKGPANGASYTPQGFIEHNPDTELIFPPALWKHEFKPLAFGNDSKTWLRPATLHQLLEIKRAMPSAKVIGGSTETQIEIKFKAMQYNVSIFVGDIAELRGYTFADDHLLIGANITLTDLEAVLKEGITKYGSTRAQPLMAMLKQLEYFAGRQIRNVGTPAGNLATASPISDLNPVFVATRGMLLAQTLEGGEVEIPMTRFFLGYRSTALPADSVIVSIRIPLAREKGEFIRAYKQSKRKDDDIAIVNAALRVSLDDENMIESTNLVYGGMAPTTVQAKQTMDYLVGKMWGAKDVLEGAMHALERDFNLSFGVPGGMATYRKTLALGFFYRFWHEVSGIIYGEVLEELVTEIKRDISSGVRDEESTQAYQQRVLGKALPHVAAMKQVTGEAQYIDDIPKQSNELYACLVLSTKPHAKILNVDTSAALDLPGVHSYVDHRDLPNPEANRWGAPVCDELFFAVDKVLTAGQPIGAVLAETQLQAAAAARAVKVEYEDLPAILTTEEAIAAESFFDYDHSIRKGLPINEAMVTADRVISGVARLGGQEHFYLETNAVLVVPKPEDGEVEVFSSTQNPTETQAYVAQVCNVPANRVVVRVRRLGGGFGGKETRPVPLAAICAIAAKKLKRPVRCMLNRDEDMMTTGQRHPFLGRWKVGVNNDGKIVALDADLFSNGGWTQDYSAAIADRALTHIDNCYLIPNVDVRARVCRTNTLTNTAFRGFGGPQGMFICESFMEEVADTIGIPVDRLREINMYKEGDTTHFNQELTDWHVPLLVSTIKQEADYAKRRSEVDEFNRTHKWKKRGLSLIPTKFGISFTALFLNQAGALVHIYHDGSVLVAHGGTEMGQGLHTKMSMIAAEALGVPLSSIQISETATNTVANSSATAASASSDLNGQAIWNACQQLNSRLQPYRDSLGSGATMQQLAHAAYFDRVNLSANGFYRTPDIGYTWGANTGMMYFYFTQGAAIAEVEVDTLTGDWTCLRADVKMDVGRSINPSIDHGQIEGAFVQGQGLFTTEESLWYKDGQLATRGPGAYKIPAFRDIPQVFNVGMLKGVEWKNLKTIQRSKGIGEPPLFMGSSVFFAIRDALKSARADRLETRNGDPADDKPLSLTAPATTERIRLACNDHILERCKVLPKDGEKEFFVAI